MKITLTYFRPDTGKYYSEGEFECPDDTHSWDVINLVRGRHAAKKLPGLVEGAQFDVLINGDVPHFIRSAPEIEVQELIPGAKYLIVMDKESFDEGVWRDLAKKIKTHAIDAWIVSGKLNALYQVEE